jgi:glycosyl transferase, family 25
MLTYCINLERRPDRRADAQKQCDVHGVAVEFFAAIDGSRVAPPTLKLVSKAEWACGESHRCLWRKLLQSDKPAALVLEDDVEFEAEFTDVLSSAMDAAERHGYSFDLLYPGYNWHMKDKQICPELYEGRSTGTHCYVVTRAGAEQLLQRYDPTQLAVDIHMFKDPGLRCVLTAHCVAYHSQSESDITDGRLTKLAVALAGVEFRNPPERSVVRAAPLCAACDVKPTCGRMCIHVDACGTGTQVPHRQEVRVQN